MEERKVIYNGGHRCLKGTEVIVTGQTPKMYKFKVYLSGLSAVVRGKLRYDIHMPMGRDFEGEYFHGSVLKKNTGWVDALPDAMFTI